MSTAEKEKHLKLQETISKRMGVMQKKWASCSTTLDRKTYVEVTFYNSDGDFKTTRYPSIDEAIKDQTRKLKRDPEYKG